MKTKRGARLRESGAAVLDKSLVCSKCNSEEAAAAIKCSKCGAAFPAKEATAASSAGQLQRPRKPFESRRPILLPARFVESAAPDQAKREMPVILLEEGMGNPDDRHVYQASALEAAAASGIFEGAKMGADHPDKVAQQTRPEGSIRDIVGYYHGVTLAEGDGGKKQLRAIAHINAGDSFTWAWDLLTEAVEYQKKFPGKTLVGFSINAGGTTHEDTHTDGQTANFVDEITAVQRVDIVTQPGAGGKPLSESLRESVRTTLKESGDMPMKDKLKKIHEALMKVREAMKGAPEHDKAYGGSMDEAMKEMGDLMAAEAAPAPAADAKPKPEDAPAHSGDDDKDFAQESTRYTGGKMTPGEKALFEKWAKTRGAFQLQEAEAGKVKNSAMIAKKLKESGLPEKTQTDLSLILAGKDDKFVEAAINDRKTLLESITGNRASGAGAAAGGDGKSQLHESLAKAGLPMREVKA